jgi:hypothetical protein
MVLSAFGFASLVFPLLIIARQVARIFRLT